MVVIIHACSTGPDPEPIPQAEILEIRMTPNTVAVGDTMLIHCVIEDSLDERFKFGWSIQGDGKFGDTTTIDNVFKWKAPNELGTYNHSVEAFNSFQDSLPDAKSFTVTE